MGAPLSDGLPPVPVRWMSCRLRRFGGRRISKMGSSSGRWRGRAGHRLADNHGLVERLDRVIAHKLDLVLADLDAVTVLQLLLLDRLAVDVRTVGAVEVFNHHIGAMHQHHGVLAADSEVIDHNVVIGPPTDRGPVLRQLDFLDNDLIDRHDHFRHDRLLFL